MTPSLVRFAARRLAAAAVFVLIVAASAFALTRLAPGDATTDLVASGASPAVIARERARLGLDRPFIEQAATWGRGLLRGDFGESSVYGRPVAELVVGRAGATAQLAALALVLATVIGVPLGIVSGAMPRHWLARVTAPLSLALVSCPPIVGALALLLLAASTGWMSIGSGALLVPVLALALPLAASLERLQAQAVRDVVAAPDLVAAAARGIPPRRLIWVHAARQSLRPVLGVYGVVIGSLFGGSFAVEVVTGWPGLGRLMYDALRGRDVFLVAGCAFAGAVCLTVGNVIADVLRAVVDPRARETL
ncbi:MAG: ABC transporter permease [Acidobacteria bacterium]|nr:ABC transporter permease [Acidobacteriota bacterium]